MSTERGPNTCRFCGQWNPPGALRCAFCQNATDAQQDQTTAGRTRMSAEQVAALPAPQRSMFDRPRQNRKVALDLQGIPGWVLRTGAVVIVALIAAAVRLCN